MAGDLSTCPEKACADGWCDPQLGSCTYEAVADGLPCEVGDLCGDLGTCQSAQCIADEPVFCDDDDPCTSDNCDPVAGCVFTPIEDCGNDGDYATWNPEDKQKNIQLSNAWLTATVDTKSVNDTVRATLGKSAGRWYWEISIDVADGGTYNGVCIADGAMNLEFSPGMSEPGINYKRQGKILTTDGSVQGDPYGLNDVVGVALDADQMQVYLHVNGVWQMGGVPETNTGGVNLGIPIGELAFPCINISQHDVYTANFGQLPFVYAPPNGFEAGVFNTE
jgi:hypothetical protein